MTLEGIGATAGPEPASVGRECAGNAISHDDGIGDKVGQRSVDRGKRGQIEAMFGQTTLADLAADINKLGLRLSAAPNV